MSESMTVPSRVPGGGGLNLAALFSLWECSSPFMAQSRQWLACFSATLTMVIVGTINGWTTIFLPYLISGTGGVPMKLTDDESSWVVSLTILGSMIGSLVAAQLADHGGRKYCLLVCSTMCTVGWFIIYAATSVAMLYLARVILGIGIGIARTINPMYVSEIADMDIRGSLGTLIAVNVYAGSLITCALGIWLQYKSLLMVLVIISFVSILSSMCFPETPYFLVAKGQKKRAWKSIAYYKRIVDPERVKIELRALRAQARYELHPKSRYELYQESGSDLHSQSGRDLAPQSSSDLPSQSRSNLPSQSTREAHSDSFWEVVDTEPMSDLNLPSSSDSPSQSTPVRHSEITCDVHQQPTGELSLQSSRQLHSQSTSELHRPSAGKIHRSSTSELHRPSASEIHRSSTSEIHRPSTSQIDQPPTSQIDKPSASKIHQPCTNEINQDLICEIQSQSGSDLRTQPNENLRGSPDIDEIYMDGNKCTCITKLQVILHRSNRKALFIMLGLIMAQQLSGNFITTQYLEVLFSKITIIIDPQEASVLVQLFSLVSGTLTILTVERVGRRILLIISTGGSCLTLTILATLLLLVEHKFDLSNISIVPVIDLIIYQVVFQIGLGTLSNVLLCELFPAEIKGFVGAVIVIFDGIIGFTVSELYQVITDNVGSYAIYYIFTTSSFMAFIVVLLWIPETKGKTYHEIEALLVGENLNSLNEEVRTDEMELRRI